MPVLNDTPGRQLVSYDLKDVFTIQTKTAAYTARFNDFVLANATDAAFTVTLPTVVNANKGARIVVKKTDASANVVTIATEDSAHIDGADTVSIILQYKNYTMVTDGANWYVEAGATSGALSEWNMTAQAAAYSANFDDFVLGDAALGGFNVTLPTVAGMSGGRICVKKTDATANLVTLVTTDGTMIDGAATLAVTNQYESYIITTDGSNWYIE